MCGFVGFSGNYVNSNIDKDAVVHEMLDKITHRGPDSQECYCDDNTAFGFARLSIIDLEGGTQPLYNQDKTKVLIFNGEIYNYKELREDLIAKGYEFKTHVDSEVLIHGYDEYGVELLQKLRGMFAFAIWDTKTKKLFGARDHFGIKPYYYAQMGDTLIFGSEIKSFLPHPEFKKELNEECLPNYLTFACVPGYETFFKNVYKLPPAHYFEFQDGKLELTRYFTPEFEPDNSRSFDSFVDEIEKTVNNSVNIHQFADVEVGCFLSSGVDSSYVAYELSKIQDVKTYTIGFEEKQYSEADNAKMLADEIKVENFEKRVTAKDYFANVHNVQYHLDEPLANPSANLLYFVSHRAAQDVKVVLSGEGADEMFAGYNVYKEPLTMQKYQKMLPIGLRKFLAKKALKSSEFKGRNFLIRGGQTIEERYLGNSNVFKEDERNAILLKDYKASPPQTYTKPFYDKAANYDDISKMQYVDLHVWMVAEILLKADKMSMAHSLELRVPFLDVEVFNTAKKIPTKYKVSKENTKLALRASANRKINPISANRKKLAFPLPLPEWIKQDEYYNLIMGYFVSDTAKLFFNTDLIVQLLKDHKDGKPQRIAKIWAVFSFLVWYDEFFIKR